MTKGFLKNSFDIESTVLPDSDKINPFLLKNNEAEVQKALNFIASDEKFLYVHGFMGTGKRQFINYITEFLDENVVKLEYYCKEATVCDDILLAFNEIIEKASGSKGINLNAKITTLLVKFQQYVTDINKPLVIILHSYDDVVDANINCINDFLQKVIKEDNVKLIISTRAMKPEVLEEVVEDRKIFLKAFTKSIFKEFLVANKVNASEKVYEDFYKYTRGYYYYAALAVKIIQAMKIDLSEFLQKFNQSEMSFDAFLGMTYINLVPNTIRNFFWFLRTIRHGITFNALADLELYDEFSIEYLKTNLMIFQVDETIYVQDYFLQKIDISIPEKTQMKLHKYIIGIYEKLLKVPLKERSIVISRQALRAEIVYHNFCVNGIKEENVEKEETQKPKNMTSKQTQPVDNSIATQINEANILFSEKKYTDAIEKFLTIVQVENIDLRSLVEVRLKLAKLYKEIGEYSKSAHYYELVETYYAQHKEFINLNYLYDELAELYFRMYKNDRAIETIKKVIYSVDTPQSLMVKACITLGNIYSEINDAQEAFIYYKKALESLEENVEPELLAELYFKYALANDDKGDVEQAFDYYNKCIAIEEKNSYRALAYSNLASCYYENENYEDARYCFEQAYDIEKANNNFEGIYYNALHIAKILEYMEQKRALDFYIEAKKSAEFINEDFYIMESTIALGDYFYNNPKSQKEALIEYFKAKKVALKISENDDLKKIETRINDMKLRMNLEDFASIEKRYDK